MGFGSLFDSTSKSDSTAIQPTLTTGGDASPAINLTAGKQLTGNAVALSPGSTPVSSGNNSRTNLGGQQILAGNNSQVDLLDGGAIPSITLIAQQALALAAKNNSDLNSTVGSFLNQAADTTATSLANNQALAANAATGGASTASSTIIKILGGFGVFLVLGLAIYFFRKK